MWVLRFGVLWLDLVWGSGSGLWALGFRLGALQDVGWGSWSWVVDGLGFGDVTPSCTRTRRHPLSFLLISDPRRAEREHHLHFKGFPLEAEARIWS